LADSSGRFPVWPVVALITFASAGAAWFLSPLPWPARAYTILLLVPLPALLILQARLAADLPEDAEREAVYLSSALTVWILAAMAMLVARVSDFGRTELRLVPLPTTTLLAATALTFLAGIAVMAAGRLLKAEETPLVHFLIPRSGSEKIAFTGLSFSAGIAEELVFRSFLIAALHRASGSLSLAVALSLVVFATTHAYQGWIGAIRVTILGLILTVPFLITGSVYPSILAHIGLDLVAGLVLADWVRGTARKP
jgi:membrane protease YdiL (CAAX protease family)